MPRKQNIKTKESQEWEQKLISLDRVTRVVAGGKRFRFRATLIIGNKKGRVGMGVAKGADVSIAIGKAFGTAKKNTIDLPLEKGTIPFESQAKFNSAEVLLRPAKSGKGIMAGGAVRTICELGGVENIVGKIIRRSTNQINNSKATFKAFESIRTQLKVKRDFAASLKPKVKEEKEIKETVENK